MSEYTEGPWIEHTTGEMPVPGDTMVRWKVPGIDMCQAIRADQLSWEYGTTLTHYRIQADKDGWIRHVPGECPVDPKRLVSVRLQSSSESKYAGTSAGDLQWGVWGEFGKLTITEYKVAGEASEQPAQPAQPASTLEELIDAALSYKQARSSHTAALERLSDAVKAFKGE